MSVSSNGWHLRVSLVTLVSLLLSGCGGAAAGGEKRAMAASSKPSVDVVRLVYKPFRATTRLQGELSPFEAVSLYAKLNGFVSRVHVDRGSVVRKGARLVSLQAPELSARRAEAEAKVRASKGFHDRLKAAAKTPGAVAGNELALADAQLAGDLAKVRALRALEQYLNVVAPFSGVVTKRNVHTGALVGPATEKVPMLRLEQIATLRLTVPVPETLVAAVRVGTTETFTVRAWPGQGSWRTRRRFFLRVRTASASALKPGAMIASRKVSASAAAVAFSGWHSTFRCSAATALASAPVIDGARRSDRPRSFSARDALTCMEEELNLCMVVISDVRSGAIPNDSDWARYLQAAGRIARIAEEARR